jgi:hypothetical protein
MDTKTVMGVFFACVALAFGGYSVGRETAPDVEPAKQENRAAEPGETAVSLCGTEKPVQKPKEIIGSCADGGVVAKDINWSYWTANVAVGTATVSANDCEPSCADGSFIARPANVMLDQRQENGSGPQFTRMVVAYQDHRPSDEDPWFEEVNVVEYSLPMHPSS